MDNNKDFNTRLLELFAEAATERVISKGALLLKEGEVETNLYLIVSGAVRVCYLTEFEEHTIRFGYEGSFINSLASFFRKSLLNFTSKPFARPW